MRYYDIQITNKDGSKYAQYTSLYPSGLTNANALNVEFDITQAPMHQPAGNSMVKVWGLDFKSFSNAMDFNGKNIKVFGGMQKGLPLANPKQAGLLIQGTILQAFGNWVETDITVTFIISTGTGSPDAPLKLVFNWPKNSSLKTAISNMLNTAFPGIRQDFQINANLVLSNNQIGVYETLPAFSRMMNALSKAIITDPKYIGVTISFDGNVLTIADQPNPRNPIIKIVLADLMQQPMWIAPNQIQCRFVMRGDLNISDQITLPATPITTTAAASTQFQDPSTFSGTYMIQFLRHVGNFRQWDGASWNTTANMTPSPKTST